MGLDFLFKRKKYLIRPGKNLEGDLREDGRWPLEDNHFGTYHLKYSHDISDIIFLSMSNIG